MRIVVAVKRANDYPHSINPYDLVAVEAALRLREAGVANEILAVSIGTAVPTQEILRTVLAMGADRGLCLALHASIESMLQPLGVAKLLRTVVHQEKPSLVMLGRQSVGLDQGQTGQMLAALLDWPQGTFVTKIDDKIITLSQSGETNVPPSTGGKGLLSAIEITRETGNGLHILSLPLPAVIMVELCLNMPRLITVPNIVKAKQKPLDTILLGEKELDTQPRLLTRRLTPVSTCRLGIKVRDIAELLDKLRHEARVL